MKPCVILVTLISLLVTALEAEAQFSLAPLTTWGGANNDGWWAVGEAGATTGLTTAGTERGLAYGNNHVYLSAGAGATPSVRILDRLTGVEVGTLDMTGVTLGSANRALCGIKVGADGAIHGGNLSLNVSTAPFVVYRWATEASAPTVVFTGAPLTGARLGDSLDAIGSGAAATLVAGYSSTPVVAGNNGYAVIDPTLGTATHISFAGTPPAAGDFRLGITFAGNSTTVIGDQGNATTDTRLTTYAAGVGTLVASLTLNAIAERHMDYAVVNGISLFATIETGGGATTSTVRVYDMSNPLAPLLLGSLKNQTDPVVANANGTGGLNWGDIINNGDGTSTAFLYAMNSNNGLEAFLVTIPEPSVYALIVVGLTSLIAMRRFRR